MLAWCCAQITIVSPGRFKNTSLKSETILFKSSFWTRLSLGSRFNCSNSTTEPPLYQQRSGLLLLPPLKHSKEDLQPLDAEHTVSSSSCDQFCWALYHFVVGIRKLRYYFSWLFPMNLKLVFLGGLQQHYLTSHFESMFLGPLGHGIRSTVLAQPSYGSPPDLLFFRASEGCRGHTRLCSSLHRILLRIRVICVMGFLRFGHHKLLRANIVGGMHASQSHLCS